MALPAPRALLSQTPSYTPWTVASYFHLHHHHHAQQQPTRRHASTKSHSHAHSHTRPPSAAQPLEKRIVPSTSSTSTTSLTADINPPASTHPAELNLPSALPPTATQTDKLKRYIALGRTYLSFYKTGLKNVYGNYRASVPIRRQLGLPAYVPSSPAPKVLQTMTTTLLHSNKQDGPAAATTSTAKADNRLGQGQGLSRATFQLLHRAAHDIRRMIPFTLILIICGEFTPLVVLALGNAVTPYTCRVPGQIQKHRVKQASIKRAALGAHCAATRGSITPPEAGSEEELDILTGFADANWVEAASGKEVLRAAAVFGLARSHARSAVLGSVLYRRRVRGYVEYIRVDDGLIRACGGVGAMEGVEVRRAVEERGGVGVAFGKEGWEAERVERRWLEGWLERSKTE